MPTYAIQAPNGQTYHIDGPDGATDEQVRAEVLRQFPEAAGAPRQGETVEYSPDDPNSLHGTVTDEAAPQQSLPDAMGQSAEAVAGKVAKGFWALPDLAAKGGEAVTNGISSVIGAGVDAILRAHGASQGTLDEWAKIMAPHHTPTMGERIDQTMPDTVAPGAGGAAELLGGAMLPIPGGGAAPKPAGFPAAAEAAGSPAARTVAAGQTFGIDVPMGATGRAAAGLEKGLDILPPSAGVMQRGRDKLTGQVENAVENVASEHGTANNLQAAGEALQSGAKQWISKADQTIEKAYGAISIPPKTQSALTNTRAGLAAIIRGFESNPELSKIWTGHPRLRATLEALTPTDYAAQGRAALEAAEPRLAAAKQEYDRVKSLLSVPDLEVRQIGQRSLSGAETELAAAKKAVADAEKLANSTPEGGQVSWEDFKRLRSIVGEMVGDPGLSADGNAKAALRNFYGAMSEDMRATAAAQGPKALNQFERANSLFRNVQNRKEGALTAILGDKFDKPAEAAGRLIQTISKSNKGSSDIAKLAQIRASMPREEWGDVAGTLIRLTGQPANSSGREFSAETFVRNFDDMSNAAKSLLFGDRGRGELRANLEDFSKVMGSLAKNNSLRNTSNTAPALAAGGVVSTGLSALLSPILAAKVVAGGVANYQLAKLWTNPKFVKWATGYTKMVAGAARAGSQPSATQLATHTRLLQRVALTEPAIANDITGLQQRLQQAFSASPERAAAAPSDAKADPYSEFPTYTPTTQEMSRPDWKREDGSQKGMGFLGLRKRPDGGVSSELSVSFDDVLGGKDIPTMVPGLTPDEVKWLLTTPEDDIARKLPESIRRKAIAHAIARDRQGLSPFKQPGEGGGE